MIEYCLSGRTPVRTDWGHRDRKTEADGSKPYPPSRI
jgi:hypothetical protein